MERLTNIDTDLAGQVVVVLGPNCPRGRATVEHLLRRNAHVVMAGGTIQELADTRLELLANIPLANVGIAPIDAARSDASAAAARAILDIHPRVDLLINNSCEAAPGSDPVSADTAQGRDARGMLNFTVALLPGMALADDPRIVTVVTSQDLDTSTVPAPSTLSIIDFVRELDRRLRRAGSRVRSVAANPTAAVTTTTRDLVTTAPTGAVGRRLASHLALRAATPVLVAATMPSVSGCTFSTPSSNPSADPIRHSLPPGDPGARRRWDLAACSTNDVEPVIAGPVAA